MTASSNSFNNIFGRKFLNAKTELIYNLIENSPAGLFRISSSGFFILANKELKKIIKVEGYDLYRANIFDYLNREDAQKFKERISTPKREFQLTFKFIIGEKTVPYQVTLSPDFKGKEFKGGWSGVVVSIPNNKIQTPLVSELDKLKNSHEIIKEQLAHLCHEVRIPINTIMGMSYLLAEKIDERTKKNYLEPLFSSADYLGKLVNSILDFSKMEGGHMELHEEEFNLKNVLTEIQDAFGVLLKEKSIAFELDNQIEQEIFYGDSLRLKQILSNLLNNASKFTLEGSIGLRTYQLEDYEDRTDIRFEIWDTGIGIPQDKLNTVFEEYKQADTQVAAKFGGTGLGLSIVQELVRLHGGKINLKSKEGEGTTFIIDIPYKKHAPKAFQTLPKADNLYRELIKGKKVLVFEDDTMGQKLMQNVLENWECQFKILSEGIIDATKIDAENYDLILMDINLPGKNGYQITEELRSKGIAVPIIALTGSTMETAKAKAYVSGMSDYISKPFSLDDLEKVVGKWV